MSSQATSNKKKAIIAVSIIIIVLIVIAVVVLTVDFVQTEKLYIMTSRSHKVFAVIDELGSAALGFVFGGIGGGAQHGLTGARQAALSTKNQIIQKFASGGYGTYNNYLFAMKSNALRIENATKTLNKLAVMNIFEDYSITFEAMFYQGILLG